MFLEYRNPWPYGTRLQASCQRIRYLAAGTFPGRKSVLSASVLTVYLQPTNAINQQHSLCMQIPLSAFPLPKPSLGSLAWSLLYSTIPQAPRPTHLTTKKVKHYETSAMASALLTTALSRARINRAICPCEDSTDCRHWIEKAKDIQFFPYHFEGGIGGKWTLF